MVLFLNSLPSIFETSYANELVLFNGRRVLLISSSLDGRSKHVYTRLASYSVVSFVDCYLEFRPTVVDTRPLIHVSLSFDI